MLPQRFDVRILLVATLPLRTQVNPIISLRLIQCDRSNVTKFRPKQRHVASLKKNIAARTCVPYSQCDFITRVRCLSDGRLVL